VLQAVATYRINQLLSLWRHSRYDVIRAACTYGTCNPRASYSHYDVILIVTSLAIELATPNVTVNIRYVRTPSPHLIYKDSDKLYTFNCLWKRLFVMCSKRRMKMNASIRTCASFLRIKEAMMRF